MLRIRSWLQPRPEKCHTVRELTEELAVRELCLSLRVTTNTRSSFMYKHVSDVSGLLDYDPTMFYI